MKLLALQLNLFQYAAIIIVALVVMIHLLIVFHVLKRRQNGDDDALDTPSDPDDDAYKNGYTDALDMLREKGIITPLEHKHFLSRCPDSKDDSKPSDKKE